MARKASLQLSINAIVIVVLAFVLLGLGLGFIRSQFKQIGSTTGQVQEQVKQQILEDLRTGDKKLSFPTQRVQLEKGGTKDLAIGIKNTKGSGKLGFYIGVFIAQKKGTDDEPDIRCDEKNYKGSVYGDFEPECDGDLGDSLKFFWDYGPYSLSVADSGVYPISIEDVLKESHTYLVKIRIYGLENGDDLTSNIASVYAEKSFFVQVT